MNRDQFLQTVRLAARIHGLILARMPRLTKDLNKVVKDHSSLFKRPTADQLETLANELPVLVLILVIQEMERLDLAPDDDMAEFLKSSLIHFFASHYIPLYLEHKDPIKETLTRVDWYLDGSGKTPESLFAGLVRGLLPGCKEEMTEPVVDFINNSVLPQVKKALDLAPRYRL
ncbi:MAG: hypothetical protein JRJ59_00040 [Deltaproteobacteria bacterium]|nr:hypothetical protein [Deltaproteobacteria bacterium]